MSLILPTIAEQNKALLRKKTGPKPKKKLSREEFLSILWVYMAKNRWYDAARILWPWFVHNPQTEYIYEEISANRECYLLGHGSGGKTLAVGSYAFLRWLWRPMETSVLLCGPTLKSLDSRLWSVIVKCATQAKIPLYCDVLQSRHIVRFHDYNTPPDDPDRPLKNEEGHIQCVDGSTERKDHRIRGLHTPYVIVLVDEGDAPNLQAVWDAIPNLESSGNFELKAMTNPTDSKSAMGKRTEPIDGYRSLDIETDFAWGTKGGGRVVRLDVMRSPNIVAKQKLFSFLPDVEWVEKRRALDGEHSPVWYSQVRAFYPPDGMVNQIFPVQIVDRLFANDRVFLAETIKIAALDPAYEDGGARCVLWVGEAGRDAVEPKRMLVRLNQGFIIKRSDPNKLETEDRGDQVISLCQAHEVRPNHFCYDTTGNGLAVGDYIRAKWSRDVLPVGFSAAVSEMRVLDEDTKKASERFDRFVTELWFAARDWVRAGHVIIHPECMYRDELRLDLESRRYFQLPHEKVKAEKKMDMIERGLESPDFGDAFCLLIHVVRFRISEHMPNAAGPRIEIPQVAKSYWEKLRHPEKPPAVGLATAKNPKYRRR